MVQLALSWLLASLNHSGINMNKRALQRGVGIVLMMGTAIFLFWVTLALPGISQPPADSIISKDSRSSVSLRLPSNASRGSIDPATFAKAAEAMAQTPIRFEKNIGQAASEVEFVSRASGYALLLQETESVMVLTRPVPPRTLRDILQGPLHSEAPAVDSVLLKTKWVGAAPARSIASQLLPTETHYFRGNNPDDWHCSVPNYASVTYEDLYPGVDLVYYGSQNEVEYDLRVQPGSNPETIHVRFEGADELQIQKSGDLVLNTPAGEVRHRRPVVYQDIDGERQLVAGHYVRKGRFEIGFQVPRYDHSRTLIIDPLINYSTLLGGTNDEIAFSMATDSSGAVYLTGETQSGNFPVTGGAANIDHGGARDIFVVKLNPEGNGIDYSTYIGGGDEDSATGILVDGDGSTYVTGFSVSTDFPTTAEAFQTSKQAGQDAVLFKLSPDGSTLQISTYYGANGGEIPGTIAMDSGGNILIGGVTASTTLQTSGTAFQPANRGGIEGFIAKFDNTLSLLSGTYLGGSGEDRVLGIATDSNNNIYAIGYSASEDLVTASFQNSNAGGFDVVVYKFDEDLGMIFGTYLGGDVDDFGIDIKVDALGRSYLVGHTASLNFPTTPGAIQSRNRGNFDLFVSQLDAGGDRLISSTLLGGKKNDFAGGIFLQSISEITSAAPSSVAEQPTGPLHTNPVFTDTGQLVSGVVWDSEGVNTFPLANTDASVGTPWNLRLDYNSVNQSVVIDSNTIVDVIPIQLPGDSQMDMALLNNEELTFLDTNGDSTFSVTSTIQTSGPSPFSLAGLNHGVGGEHIAVLDRTGICTVHDPSFPGAPPIVFYSGIDDPLGINTIQCGGEPNCLWVLGEATSTILAPNQDGTYTIADRLNHGATISRTSAWISGPVNDSDPNSDLFIGGVDPDGNGSLFCAYSGESGFTTNTIPLDDPPVGLGLNPLPDPSDPSALAVVTPNGVDIFFNDGGEFIAPGQKIRAGSDNIAGGIDSIDGKSGHDIWTIDASGTLWISEYPDHPEDATDSGAIPGPPTTARLVDFFHADDPDNRPDFLTTAPAGVPTFTSGLSVFSPSQANPIITATIPVLDSSFPFGGSHFSSGADATLPTYLPVILKGPEGQELAESRRSSVVSSNIEVHVTGGTAATDFPVSPGAFQVTHRGGLDAFARKIQLPEVTLPSIKFPRLTTTEGNPTGLDQSQFTGLAVANLGSTAGPVFFTAYDTGGSIIGGQGITNPATRTLNPGEQLPIVDAQLFGSELTNQNPIGWIEVHSILNKLVGFFLMFNGTLSILDGADVSSDSLLHFIFPEIEDEGFTQIHVANPNPMTTSLTIELLKSDGTSRAPATHRNVPADGAVAEFLTDLFPGVTPVASDYLRVTATRRVVPFQLLGKAMQYVEGLNGQDATAGSKTLYCPQYVVGGPDWRTTLSIISIDSSAGTVTLKFFGDDGIQQGSTKQMPISARGKLFIEDQRFFLDAGGALTQGYVEITSDVRLRGSVVFGDPSRSTFSAALPLASGLMTRMVYSQLASNETYFMGVAILNPGDTAMTATIEVYDASGALLFTTDVAIAAKQRKSQLLTQFLPAMVGQNFSSGYVRVNLSSPGASFALFGTNILDVLSAVVAQAAPGL